MMLGLLPRGSGKWIQKMPHHYSLSPSCVVKKEIGPPQNLLPFSLPLFSISTQSLLGQISSSLQYHSFFQRTQKVLRISLYGKIAMANMIMASSKPIISPAITSTIAASRPKLQNQLTQLSISLPRFPKISKSQLLSHSSSTLKSISLFAATSLTLAPPSLAEVEKAALFDFDLTLPIMMVQFLILMVALDKVYFSPLGKFMDERDAAIKETLGSVKDTSEEVKQLEEQAAAVMRAARAEISAALNKMKKETQIEVEQKLAEGRKKVEAELQEALDNLEKQREETIRSLDSQIAALSQEIVNKVLPVQ